MSETQTYTTRTGRTVEIPAYAISAGMVDSWCEYQELCDRVDDAFAPVRGPQEPVEAPADQTDEFREAVAIATEQAMHLPGKRAKGALKEIADLLEARDTKALAGIEFAAVLLTDAQWTRLARQTRISADCPSW